MPLLRCRADALPARPPHDLPNWLVACVRHGQFAPREPLKLSFVLEPHAACRLPELPPSARRLSAPRALKVSPPPPLPLCPPAPPPPPAQLGMWGCGL